MTVHKNLAVSYVWQWVSQQSRAAQTLESAVAAAQQALALNDSWHWNYIFLGHIYLYQQQYEPAPAEMERAVALAPTEAGSYAAVAEVLSRVGRTGDALEVAEVRRLNPNSSLVAHKEGMPIKDPAVLERPIAVLRKAGLK